MNSCVLMAKVVRNPELRYTTDQLAIANMMVEFDGLGPNDSLQTIKTVGFGNLATEINERYKEGDQIVMEGRLSMNTFDRSDGLKEKRAELIIARIFAIGGSASSSNYASAPSATVTTPSPSTSNVIPFQNNPSVSVSQEPKITANITNNNPSNSPSDADLDDIPF